MIEFVNQLIEAGIEVAVVTNTIPTHWNKIKQMLLEACPRLSEDHVFASCELSRRKTGKKEDPEFDMFQEVLRRLNLPAQEILFLDDNRAYTAQARENKIAAIDVRPGDQYTKERVLVCLGRL
jgi:FMN phosphatase YigB (HAD superfamily)